MNHHRVADRAKVAISALFGLLVLVCLIDAGSCAITRVQVANAAKNSAQAAAEQIVDHPVNAATAEDAYRAAVKASPRRGQKVIEQAPGDAEDFRVGADLSVTLTVQGHAPTLIFRFIPKLKDFTVAKTTYTQQQLGM